MSAKANHDLLNFLSFHETKVSELYQAFAMTLPDFQSFWLELVKEEHGHATWLRELKSKLNTGEGMLNRNRFPATVIQTSIAYLNKTIAMVHRDGITPLRALAIALDIENALLEKDFFHVYESDSVYVRQTLDQLQTQTMQHRHEIQKKIDAERAKEMESKS